MSVPFSQLPGRHERHLRRRLDPLFPRPVVPPVDEALREAQRLAHVELIAYEQDLRDAVAAAVRPGPSSRVTVPFPVLGWQTDGRG